MLPNPRLIPSYRFSSVYTTESQDFSAQIMSWAKIVTYVRTKIITTQFPLTSNEKGARHHASTL